MSQTESTSEGFVWSARTEEGFKVVRFGRFLGRRRVVLLLVASRFVLAIFGFDLLLGIALPLVRHLVSPVFLLRFAGFLPTAES